MQEKNLTEVAGDTGSIRRERYLELLSLQEPRALNQLLLTRSHYEEHESYYQNPLVLKKKGTAQPRYKILKNHDCKIARISNKTYEQSPINITSQRTLSRHSKFEPEATHSRARPHKPYHQPRQPEYQKSANPLFRIPNRSRNKKGGER